MSSTRAPGLYVGADIDASTHARADTSIGLDPASLTTHGVIVGMTGSGKTGLGMVILEEALSQGIPVLVLDPKGDMGNLLLTFPDLAPADFAPWVPAGTDATATATQWHDGLADWGIAPTEIATLRSGHEMIVYTPGSTTGVPLNLIGSLAPPPGLDSESIHDEVESLVQGLLGLVDITSDPMSGREHVLMANIIETAWANGETLDLPALLLRIQDPPMRKLGVIEIDAFFPKPDRTALMMRLNGLLASPSFAAWGQGQPLDIASMLWAPDGSARAAVVYLAHLSDSERQMVVTRVLSKMVGWMRGQAGSTTLRALVYMDEVYGFVPPTAEPPSKKPLLTLFKQARAFGVGVVLSTQNPVDLDYKAISNAGTWMIGRLQTEQDKARLLEGMSSAAGTVDLSTLAATISGLGKREFLLHSTSGKAPRTFSVRWAMSYLCGPIAKNQIPALPGEAQLVARAAAVSGAAPAPGDTAATALPPTAIAAGSAPGAVPSTGAPPAAPVPPAIPTADDESPAMPAVAAGIPVRYLDPAAPWAAGAGATPGGRRLQAAVAVRCVLRFDDTKAALNETETWEAILAPVGDSPTAEDAVPVDYDDRDLQSAQPPGTVYVLPTAALSTKAFFTGIETSIKNRLLSDQAMTIQANRQLKLFSRPGETPEAFTTRCTQAADAAADAEADKIRQRLESKIGALRDQVATAQQQAAQLQEQASMSKSSELLQVGGSVLGALFGGRRSVSSISGAVNRAATGRSRTSRTNDRLETAMARIDEKSGNLTDLEAELTTTLQDIHDKWTDVAAAVESLDVPLEKGDITIEQVALVWIPT